MAGTKSRAFAIIFTIFMILSALIYGPVRSLARLSDKAMDEVFSKTENAVSLIIEKKAGEAMNLTSIAKRELAPNDPLIIKIEEIHKNIKAAVEEQDVKKLFELNDELEVAIKNLSEEIESNLDFSGEDVSTAYSLLKQIESSNNMLSYNDYSKKAEKYNQALYNFPTNIYGKIFSFKALPAAF